MQSTLDTMKTQLKENYRQVMVAKTVIMQKKPLNEKYSITYKSNPVICSYVKCYWCWIFFFLSTLVTEKK